jgi:hypothetical protein
MNGSYSRSGFRFQDHYLLSRTLRVMADAFPKAWGSVEELLPVIRRLPYRFGVEVGTAIGTSTPNGQLEWDVLVVEGPEHELAEVKSGAVSQPDRIAFWLRLRSEVSKRASGGAGIYPGFVLDPDRANSAPWLGLAREALALPAEIPLPTQPVTDVRSASDLLNEALWFLCCAADWDSKPIKSAAISSSVALELLGRFRFHAVQKDALERRVEDAIMVLFPDGWPETIRRDLRAWLDERSDPRNPKGTFSIGELVAQAHLLERTIAAPPGEIARWRALWDRLPKPADRVRWRIGHDGEELKIADVQPGAAKALAAVTEGGVLALGHAGLGKSVLSTQVQRTCESAGAKTFWCSVEDVGHDEIADVVKSLVLWAGICLLRGQQPVWLIVDGLDEVDGGHRCAWIQALVRLGNVTGLRVLVTMRAADWRDDGEVRRALGHWPQLRLGAWSEEIVRRLLGSQTVAAAISGNLLALLCTPILLDLFWRTFVETSGSPAAVHTRHGLMLAFWQERLLDAHRRSHISRVRRAECLRDASELGAARVGPFSGTGFKDTEALSVLVSEGLLVEHAGPQPRFDFRHPLLRDFALAQWCLKEDDAQKTVERWLAIEGAPQRHGCLRAILEALSDPGGGPSFNVADFAAELIRVSPDGVRMLARVLGRIVPTNDLDPASWPPTIRNRLPDWFASELVYSAQRQNTPAWAERIGFYWPDQAPWFDATLTERLCAFCEVIHEDAKRRKVPTLTSVVAIAHKLRSWSENPAHQAGFGDRNGWVLRRTVAIVCAVDPSSDALSWIERLVVRPDRGIHSAILEGTPALAPHDPVRAANLFRRAIGLSPSGATPQFEPHALNIVLNHDLVRPLVGHEHVPSSGLLCAHPATFLPVAIDLVEAFWPLELSEAAKRRELFRLTLTPEEQAVHDQIEPELESYSADEAELIDDRPMRFWTGSSRNPVRERLLRGIESAIAHLSDQSSTTFVRDVAPILRASRLATIQSLLIGAAVERATHPPFRDLLGEMLGDARLFHALDLLHWLCAAVRIVWPSATDDARARILQNVETAGLPRGNSDRIVTASLLAGVPQDELPQRFRLLMADARAHGEVIEVPHPREMFTWSESRPGEGEETEPWVGTWPAGFDTQLLAQFRRSTQRLSDSGEKENQPADVLVAVDLAQRIFALLLDQPVAIEHSHGNDWVLHEAARVLSFSRAPGNPPELRSRGSELAGHCARLCFPIVEAIPTAASNALVSPNEVFNPPQPWFSALELLELALRSQPLWGDEELQQRFQRFISETWDTTGPGVHQLLAIKIHPRHWHHDERRRALFSKLFFDPGTPDRDERSRSARRSPARCGLRLRRLDLARLAAPALTTRR